MRLNLRGRERDGIVAPEDADALLDEIADGVRTFTDLDGEPAVASVERVADASSVAGSRADLLPDLIVRWTDRPSTHASRACAPNGSGPCAATVSAAVDSGNHTEGDAWALVVPGAARAGHAVASAPARGHRRHRRRARGRRPSSGVCRRAAASAPGARAR